MNNNRTRKKTIFGFYYRKILFFGVIFSMAGFIGWIVKANNFTADEPDINTVLEQYTEKIDIDIQPDGSIQLNGKKIRDKIMPTSDGDELRLVILDSSGQYYNALEAYVNLPEGISSDTKYEFLAIHGVGNSSASIVNERQISYFARDISPQATLTVVALMPKGVIEYPLARKILNSILQIKQGVWIVLAGILPFLTFVFLFLTLLSQHKHQKIDLPTKEISSPPMLIPPAIVGALFSQKVSAREIAATLIDLALRGDIIIVDKDSGFAFGKNKFDRRLLGYEKILLSKIFRGHLVASDREEIERRINNHFYSRKISLVSAGIYTLATRLGYFKLNPQKLHSKYRFIGLGLFLIAFGGFVVSLLFFPDPVYVVFLWVGMMCSALVISALANKIPVRTIIGQEVLSNWLAFKKYLSNPEPFPFSESNQDEFQKYLPYAIVLNCETAWAKRFSLHNFLTPEWFSTEKFGLTLEDFCLSLFPIVSYVGRSFAALKEPGFE